MAELFQKDQSVVARHLSNAIKEGELEDCNMQILHNTLCKYRPTKVYDLDAVITGVNLCKNYTSSNKTTIKKYINTTEAAELTERPYNEILNLAKTGVLPSHKTHRGHYRLNVDAVEKYFGIQINKPAEVEEKPAIKVMHATSARTRLIINENHYQEVIDRICAAKSSIRLMTGDFKLFKLKSDSKQRKNYKDGTPFINYLMEKAKQGVPVQIILSDPTKNVDKELKEFFQQMNSYPFNTRNCIRNHAKDVIGLKIALSIELDNNLIIYP